MGEMSRRNLKYPQEPQEERNPRNLQNLSKKNPSAKKTNPQQKRQFSISPKESFF